MVAERVNRRKSIHKVIVLNGEAFFLRLLVFGRLLPFLFKTMIPCIRILKLENQIENYLLSFSIYLSLFLDLCNTFSLSN